LVYSSSQDIMSSSNKFWTVLTFQTIESWSLNSVSVVKKGVTSEKLVMRLRGVALLLEVVVKVNLGTFTRNVFNYLFRTVM
jgi:hypothetical protein